MPDQFQLLVKAILFNDRSSVKELLAQNAALARAGASKPRLESSITHWIYAGDTALHVAAAGHRVEIGRSLLRAGADCRAVGKHRHSQPLHYAADGCLENPDWDARRQVRMIQLLLEAGADVHAQDRNGATPLHRAVRTRCAAAVKCLLAAGADAKLRNQPGSTPFHLAVQNTGRGGSGSERAKLAQREILEAFLEQGASPGSKDAQGKSVLDWATSDWIRELLSEGTGKARNAKPHRKKP
jgi:ankyrin repeat protein